MLRVFLWPNFATFGNKLETKSNNMKKGINIYQALFVALFCCKLGSVGTLAGLSWWTVVSPLIIGSVLGFADRFMHSAGLYGDARTIIGNVYLESVRKRATAKAIKAYKEEMRKAANIQPLTRPKAGEIQGKRHTLPGEPGENA